MAFVRILVGARTLREEQLPFSFGDDLDGAVHDLDVRLFVDGVARDADVGGPPLRVSQCVRWEALQVREVAGNLDLPAASKLSIETSRASPRQGCV